MNNEELNRYLKQAFKEQELGNLEEAERLCDFVANHLSNDSSGALSDQERITTNASMQNQRGVIALLRGDNTIALERFQSALALSESVGNVKISLATLANIGRLHWYLGNSQLSYDFTEQALVLASEVGDKYNEANILSNLAKRRHESSDLDASIDLYEQALQIFRDLQEVGGEARVLTNLGVFYARTGEHDKGLKYFLESNALCQQAGNKTLMILNLENLAQLYCSDEFPERNYTQSEDCLRRALALSEEIGSKPDMSSIHNVFTTLYKMQSRWEEALDHAEKHFAMERELTTLEAKKSSEQFGYERKASEREKQIAVERAKHEATEELLHNVLPPVIAQLMINKPTVIAERFDIVSILFADIVDFTKLSARISPEQLVEGLDEIFSSFDELAERFGLEKIKTIGDAYMVVAGAPVPRADHAKAIVEMAFGMQEAINNIRVKGTGEQVHMRIGIHCGGVVAGVIGKKKFAYDLWGDAVNTASRMESHGEAGRIHVSEEFVRTLFPTQPLPDSEGISIADESFPFSVGEGRGEDRVRAIPRGEIDIKGKGIMKTFFLERG